MAYVCRFTYDSFLYRNAYSQIQIKFLIWYFENSEMTGRVRGLTGGTYVKWNLLVINIKMFLVIPIIIFSDGFLTKVWLILLPVLQPLASQPVTAECKIVKNTNLYLLPGDTKMRRKTLKGIPVCLPACMSRVYYRLRKTNCQGHLARSLNLDYISQTSL